MNLTPNTQPTFYFIGVTTTQSSIMRIFPRWMTILGQDARIVGLDVPLNAPAATYRAIIEHMKADPLVRGALVTAHKISLYQAASDLFDWLDPYAVLCGEVSGIAKRDGQLRGYAKDIFSAGNSWKALVPPDHFAQTGAETLCFGSGGAAVALTVFLSEQADRPRRFTLVDISRQRLDHAAELHARLNSDIQFAYIQNADPFINDALMTALPPGSVVINGTGMGKDIPGSPITAAGLFPPSGRVWEFNYRGALDFLHQARRQERPQQLTIHDGWVYFLHGWTQVVYEVFQVPESPERFAQLDAAAR